MLTKLRKSFVLTLAIVFSSLVLGRTMSSAQSSAGKPADLVLENGRVYTVDAKRTRAEALALKDGKLVYVGSNAGLQPFIGDKTKVVDAAGRMVLPGFIDGHNHAYLRAEALYFVTLMGTTLESYRDETRRFLDAHPNAKQLRGVGFNLNMVLNTAMSTGRAPRLLLDDIVGRDIPAVFVTNGHHQIWANTRAIQNAGVTKATPDPLGAIIEHDSAGEPSGIFREFGAQNMIIKALPEPDPTVEDYKQSILSFQQELAGPRGVTSVLTPVHYPTENFLKAMLELDKERKLTVRYDLALWANENQGTAQIPEFIEARKKYHGARFKVDSIKIFGTGNMGALVWKQPVLEETVAALDKERFRVYVHVIGNAAANDAVLSAFEHALKTNGRRDSRHTITHVNNGAVPTAARFASLGVRADGHPVPKAFFDAGVASISSSDYPVRDFFPLVRVAAGVRNGVGLDAMIASHTINGAELIFAERETGSLEVGKGADLVVLDKNLFDIPAADIDKAKTVLTISAGQEVFRDASFSPGP